MGRQDLLTKNQCEKVTGGSWKSNKCTIEPTQEEVDNLVDAVIPNVKTKSSGWFTKDDVLRAVENKNKSYRKLATGAIDDLYGKKIKNKLKKMERKGELETKVEEGRRGGKWKEYRRK